MNSTSDDSAGDSATGGTNGVHGYDITPPAGPDGNMGTVDTGVVPLTEAAKRKNVCLA
jgi:hypothetical protein